MEVTGREPGYELRRGKLDVSKIHETTRRNDHRTYSLCIGDRYANFEKSHGVEHFQRLSHVDKIRRIIEIKEGLAELCCLTKRQRQACRIGGNSHTFRRRICQYGSHSLPAASMHSSTADASSGRIDLILSSALGDRLLNCSQASYKIAEGELDPGRKTDTEDAIEQHD